MVANSGVAEWNYETEWETNGFLFSFIVPFSNGRIVQRRVDVLKLEVIYDEPS